jgi:hypothetical protein
MAIITGVILLGVIPMYFFGSWINRKSWEWPISRKLLHWNQDREIGE